MGFPCDSVVKNFPTSTGETGSEDPLEKEMATQSSILVWKIPWMVEAGRLQSMGSQRVGHDSATSQVRFRELKKGQRDFPGSPMDKNLLANAWEMGSIPDLGRFHMPVPRDY